MAIIGEVFIRRSGTHVDIGDNAGSITLFQNGHVEIEWYDSKDNPLSPGRWFRNTCNGTNTISAKNSIRKNIQEMEKAYTEGKYTKNEMEAILQDRNCSF